MTSQFSRLCLQFLRDEDGVTTLEYAVLLGLVALGSIGAWTTIMDLSIKVGSVLTNTSDGFARAENVRPGYGP